MQLILQPLLAAKGCPARSNKVEHRFGSGDIFGLSVIFHQGRFSDATRWYAACIHLRMLTMLTAPGLTLVFLGVVVGLGIAFVWILWEVEQTSKPRRNSDRFG
jgi:hypothetical protein